MMMVGETYWGNDGGGIFVLWFGMDCHVEYEEVIGVNDIDDVIPKEMFFD